APGVDDGDKTLHVREPVHADCLSENKETQNLTILPLLAIFCAPTGAIRADWRRSDSIVAALEPED
ncbi:MAG: hypothetical protein OES35_10215, partial [Chromatiales bacterium]|nr:hypothetical protein [Chromatiales bacterium]